MTADKLTLEFESGTLLLSGISRDFVAPDFFVWDERIRQFRAPAYFYRHIVKDFLSRKIEFQDKARKYSKFDFAAKFYVEPRPYQTEGIKAWRASERCGCVVLPTGAGKSHVAQIAIELCG